MGVGYSFESIQLRGIDDTSGGQGAMDRHLGRLLPLLLVTFFYDIYVTIAIISMKRDPRHFPCCLVPPSRNYRPRARLLRVETHADLPRS